MHAAKASARAAGLIYLGLILTGFFNLVYAPSKVFVKDNPLGTLEKLSAHESLFRWGIVSGYACYLFLLILAIVLYRVFESRGRIAAALMAALAIVSVPISFIALSHHVAIADLVSTAGADSHQLSLAIDRELNSYRQLTSVAEIFWGLWLFPLAYLILKSGALPRVLGALLIVEGGLYLAGFFGPVISASYSSKVIPDLVSMAGSLSEIGVCLWLIVMGAKINPGP